MTNESFRRSKLLLFNRYYEKRSISDVVAYRKLYNVMLIILIRLSFELTLTTIDTSVRHGKTLLYYLLCILKCTDMNIRCFL